MRFLLRSGSVEARPNHTELRDRSFWKVTMRLCALILLCALLTLLAAAQQQQHAPSVPQILTWISEHFERLEYDNLNRSDHTIEFSSLTFQDCSATLSERTTSSGIANYVATQVYGPFDLSNLIPDKIKTFISTPPGGSTPRFSLSIDSAHPVPKFDTMSGEQPSSSTMSTIYMNFAAQGMANRQAKAWHDAIVSCGGKAVPDNLY